MQETIVVDESVQGKYGPQLKVGKDYYSFGKFYKGQTNFGSKAEVTVDVFVTESGRKYINSVLKFVNGKPSDSVQEEPQSKAKKEVKEAVKLLKTATERSEVDWDKIAVGKTRCLAITQLLSSILPMVITNPQNMEEVKEKAKELADFAVEYSFQD